MGSRGTAVSQPPSPPSWVGTGWREEWRGRQWYRPWVLSSLLGVTLVGPTPSLGPSFPIFKANLLSCEGL